jgi:hypothetical protein
MAFSQWKTARTVAVVVVLGATLGGAAVAQSPAPGLGTWRLNVAKSKYGPGPVPKSATVIFSAAGQGVKAVIDIVGPDGGRMHWEYSANFDGKPYPVIGNPDGDMVVAKRVNANTIETSYTLKGKPTFVNTRVVSADGKTLTVTTAGTNAQEQKLNSVGVFEKV